MAEKAHVSAALPSWPGGHAERTERRPWRVAAGVVLVLAIAVVAAAGVSAGNRAPAQVFRITSGSMQPTLAIGQRVDVDASAYRVAEPRIGDIVAFHAPVGATGETPVCGVPQAAGQVCSQATAAESDQVFIKRVVAAPGDTIYVVGGSLVRNGALQRETFAAQCEASIMCNFPIPIQVPAGAWFLMGDDRGASDDSRYWGPVPKAWLIGKVIK